MPQPRLMAVDGVSDYPDQMQNKSKGECHAAKYQQPVTGSDTGIVPHRRGLHELSFSGLLVFRQTFHLRRGAGQMFAGPDVIDMTDPLLHRIGPKAQFLGCGHDVSLSRNRYGQLFLGAFAAGSLGGEYGGRRRSSF